MSILLDTEQEIHRLHRMFIAIAMLSGLSICLLVIIGCSTLRGDKGGFHGPTQYTEVAKASVDPIIAAFQTHYGIEMKWDWSKWSVYIKEGDVPGRSTGLTHHPNKITVEPGVVSVIPHEMVHVVANMNGYANGTGANDHHRRFRKMFDQFGW